MLGAGAEPGLVDGARTGVLERPDFGPHIQPLYGDNGPGSPPAGWGNPYQEGELTLNSERSITFEAESLREEFSPAPTNSPTRVRS